MFRYCPLNRLFQKAAFLAIFFVLLSIPILSAQAAGLDDDCEAEICDSGLVCIEIDGYKICKGGIGYITDNPEDCSPELIWQDSRCQLDLGQTQGEQLNLGESAEDIRDNIKTALNIALGFLGVLGVIMLIYAGVLWMFSAGRDEQVLKAKKTILWTVAGLMIITTSWTITSYILGIGQQLGGGGGGGGGDGGDGGDTPFPPGGVVESFKIEDVETSRPDPDSTPDTTNVYTCSSVQTNFNRSADADLVEQAVTTQSLVLKDDAGVIFNPTGSDWDLVGRHLTFKHIGEILLFKPSTTYQVFYPRTLEDTGGYPLAGCDADGCFINPAPGDIIWTFVTGVETDVAPPELQVSGTYPRYFDAPTPPDDPSYPSRGVPQRPTITINFTEPILVSSVLEDAGGGIFKPKDNIQIGRVVDISGINTIVDTNQEVLVPNFEQIDNTNFVADLQSAGGGSRLVIQLSATAANLLGNWWYQIKISGVQDLCGLPMAGEKHWHFQVSGAEPRFDPTPPDGLKNVCYEGIEIGIVSNVSMYDVLTDKCTVALTGGGFITDGSLIPAVAGRNLIVKKDDDVPLPADRPVDFNFNNYCRQYFFEPAIAPLTPNISYQAQINSRFSLPDGTVLSQLWSFETAVALDHCVRPPILIRVDGLNGEPKGPKGQCITVIGRYMDYFADSIRTNNPGISEESIKIFDNDSAGIVDLNDYIDAEPDLRWSDNNAITKLPQNMPDFDVGITYLIKEKIVDMNNNISELFSTSVEFTLTDESVGPCLEFINPDNTYREVLLTLTGSDFGAAAGLVKYIDIDDSNFSGAGENWGDLEIKSIIPLQAASGFVRVQNSGGQNSNGRELTLPLLKNIVFAERALCEQNLRISPNPKNEQDNVCILGEGLPDDLAQAQLNIYLEFREPISKDFSIQSQSKFLDPDYYSLVACTGTVGSPDCEPTAIDLLTKDTSVFSFNRVYDDKITYPPDTYYNTGIDIIVKNTPTILSADQPLQFNTIYKFTISNIIDDRYANPAAQFNSQNILFKIIDSANFESQCKGVDSVQVGLTPPEIKYPESSQAKGTALNPQCQLVPDVSYQWSTDDDDPTNPDGHNVIEDLPICSGNCERITISSRNTNFLEAQANIIATEITTGADKSGFNTLTVHNSAYCESADDCKYSASCQSTCHINTHRCFPKITSISPPEAKAKDWLTVHGCYFGTNQHLRPHPASVDFVQEAVPSETVLHGLFDGFPTQCQERLWSDTSIVVIAPDGLNIGGSKVQVIIPMDEQDRMATIDSDKKTLIDANLSNEYKDQHWVGMSLRMKTGDNNNYVRVISDYIKADKKISVTEEFPTEIQNNDYYELTYHTDLSDLEIVGDSLKRPMICAVVPSEAQSLAPFILYGKDFDIDNPVFIGDEEAEFSIDKNFDSFTISNITTITALIDGGQSAESTVPKLEPNKYFVRAADGTAASNSLPFAVIVTIGCRDDADCVDNCPTLSILSCEGVCDTVFPPLTNSENPICKYNCQPHCVNNLCTPVITSFSDDPVALKQLLTIYGCYFDVYDEDTPPVWFDEIDLGATAPADKLPQVCRVDSGIIWKNNEIQVKVPQVDIGGSPLPLGDYIVRVFTKNFIINNEFQTYKPIELGGKLKPAICNYQPNTGVPGVDTVYFGGENFGIYSGDAGVVFYNNQQSTIYPTNIKPTLRGKPIESAPTCPLGGEIFNTTIYKITVLP